MGVCCPVSDNFPGKVTEVYALAELSRATFYVHYKGIYDLLEEIEEGIFE
jgi:AcrR family transcriptional regulator